MKIRFFFCIIIALILIPTLVLAGGKLQDADFKTEAELITAGADKSYLLNDSKIYVLAFDKTLDDAIADGDIGGQLTAKGNLFGFGAATQECILDKTDGKLLTVDSTATCGFDFKDAPVSTTLTLKGQYQTFDGTNNTASDVCADGEYMVWDSSTPKGSKCSSFLTGTLNPVTDWESFTPVTNITNATITGYKKIVGDTLYVKVGVDFTGTPASVIFSHTIPDSLVIDTTKMDISTSNRFIGKLSLRDSSANASYAGSVIYVNTTTVNIGSFDDDAVGSRIFTVDQATPITFATNDRIYFEYSVPILGYSSGVDAVAQNRKLLKVVAEDLTGGTDTTSFAFNYVNTVTEVEDDLNALTDAGDIIFTVPTGYDGYYDFDFGSFITTGAAVANMECGLTIVSSITGSKSIVNTSDAGTGNYNKCIFKELKLEASDTVKFYVRKAGTASVTWNTDDRYSYLKIDQQPSNMALVGTFGDCQTKYLSADVTTDTNDVADLAFSNLEIGQKYSVYMYLRASYSTTDEIVMSFRDGVNLEAQVRIVSSAGSPSSSTTYLYQADSSTIRIDLTSITASNAVLGNGTELETYATLCESKTGENTTW